MSEGALSRPESLERRNLNAEARRRGAAERTRAALSSDPAGAWERTHRFAGCTMIGGGLASIVAAMAGAPMVGLVFIMVGAFAPVVYPWRIARRV